MKLSWVATSCKQLLCPHCDLLVLSFPLTHRELLVALGNVPRDPPSSNISQNSASVNPLGESGGGGSFTKDPESATSRNDKLMAFVRDEGLSRSAALANKILGGDLVDLLHGL
eukprot:4755338-Pyramimonas_sp.AAC.1